MGGADAGEPAGGPSLAALRAAVYRPGASEVDVAALERALALLPAPVQEPLPANAESSPEPTADEDPEPPAAIRPPPRWLRPAAAAAAAIVGTAAGALLVAGAAGPSRPEVPTVVRITAAATTAVFDRPQRASDRTRAPLDPALEPGSLRSLMTAGRFRVFGARDRSGRVCLMTLQDEALSTCVSPARFRSDGLRLVWATRISIIDPAGLRELHSRLSLVATWAPNGRVTLGAVRL